MVLEVGPGLGSLTLGLLPARRARARRRDRPGAGRARCPRRGGTAGRTLTVHAADALRITAADFDAGADRAGGEPAVQRRRAGRAAPAGRAAHPARRPGDGAEGGRRPAGRRPRLQGVRHPVGEAGLVRRRARRPAGCRPAVFWPVPNVDSGLVAFTRREPPAPTCRRRAVFAVVDAAFAQRRKTLRAALAGWAGGPDRAERVLVAAGVDPQAAGRGADRGRVRRDRGVGQARRRYDQPVRSAARGGRPVSWSRSGRPASRGRQPRDRGVGPGRRQPRRRQRARSGYASRRRSTCTSASGRCGRTATTS